MYPKLQGRLTRYGITLEHLEDILLALSVDVQKDKLKWHAVGAMSDVVADAIQQQTLTRIQQQAALVEAGAA